jgi:multidrug efflux pump
VIGLLPMATGISYDFHTLSWATKSESTEFWRNMAVVVMFGLMFATVLTLVVVPSLYVMLTRASWRLRTLFGSAPAGDGAVTTPAVDAH